MLAKDAFNAACEMICEQYKEYGFKYIKSKKEIRAKINGYTLKIVASTSRDNSSDCFVKFVPSAYVADSGGKCVFSCNADYSVIEEDFFFTENIEVDLTPLYDDMPRELRQKLFQSVSTRRWAGEYFVGWNVAFPQQQKQTAIDVCYWLDEFFFSNELVIEITGKRIKAGNY